MPNFGRSYESDPEKFRRMRNEQRKKNYRKTAIYEPKNWTIREDEMVLAHDITDFELSKKIHHSVQAIQQRRCKLKKKEE